MPRLKQTVCSTCDLVFNALSNIFKCEIVIHDKKSHRTPKYYIGHTTKETFITTDPDVCIKPKIGLTEYFERQKLVKVLYL